MFKFQDYGFDKVVVLHLIEDIKRKEFLEWQFNQLDIDKDSIDWHIAVRHPFSVELSCGFNYISLEEKNKDKTKDIGNFTKPNEISCLREHYTIVKKAYYEGVNRLLIIEDDECFNKDINFLKSYCENIPDDANILQGDTFTQNPAITPILEANRPDKTKYWVLHNGIGIWNTGFVAYDRTGMRFFLNFINQRYSPADVPAYVGAESCFNMLSCYASKYPISIQECNEDIPSNIRPIELQSALQYDINLCLKGVNINEYFSYNEYKNLKVE